MLRRLAARMREPVIADRTIDAAFIAYWLSFAGWGFSALLVGIPTISRETTAVYELWWGASVGSLAVVAALGAACTFLQTERVQTRVRRKTVEMTAALALLGFLAVYPIFVIISAAQGDTARLALSFLAVQYLIFPAWRARHLFLRIRALRDLQEAAATDGTAT